MEFQRKSGQQCEMQVDWKQPKLRLLKSELQSTRLKNQRLNQQNVGDYHI